MQRAQTLLIRQPSLLYRSLPLFGNGFRFKQTSPATEKIEIFIDDKKLFVDPGMTILQVCLFKLFEYKCCFILL